MKKRLSPIIVFVLILIGIWNFSLSEKLEILNLQDIKLVAVANAESCDGVIDSNENAFCKNRPSINCGYCRVYPSGTACEFTIASNHDCYDTGH